MPKIEYEGKNFTDKTLATIFEAEAIIQEYEAQGFKLTLRQLYYQFVARELLPNTEQSYKRLGGIISDARRAGLIDWDSIEDRTRFLRSIPFWNNPLEIIDSAVKSYHRDLWAPQYYRVEVWIEKDALVGVIEGICNRLDVAYFACRGYVSDSEMWAAAQRYNEYHDAGQRVILLHLGDHDPSGIDMTRDIRERLYLFSGQDVVAVERIALTMEQIDEQGPPPNPAKVTDSRYANYLSEYGNESWELDALEPRYISNLIMENIRSYLDVGLWDSSIDEQEEERSKIKEVIDKGMLDNRRS